MVGKVYTHHGSPGGMQGVLYPPCYPVHIPTMLHGAHTHHGRLAVCAEALTHGGYPGCSTDGHIPPWDTWV